MSIMTVSELTARIKNTIEPNFEYLQVEGEVSNVHNATSGHYYFSLKDHNALIAVALFRSAAATSAVLPKNGSKVKVEGRLTVYPQRGSYQIICNNLTAMGEGAILAMLEQRKKQLAERGMFKLSNKKKLPPFITRAVIITSPHGAAIQDIIKITSRRNPTLRLIILPSLVQGAEAARLICKEIKRANKYSMGDVIVLTRGGGSLEDLLPFSEVSVVEAIAESNIPVISAVGHETDTSLSDLAADVRAPTPSAAAELISLDSLETIRYIKELTKEIEYSIKECIRVRYDMLKHHQPAQQKIYTQYYLQNLSMRFDSAQEILMQETEQVLKHYSAALQSARVNLNSLSPNSVLSRGYAIVYKLPQRTIVTKAAQTAKEETIDIQMADSHIIATVDTIQ